MTVQPGYTRQDVRLAAQALRGAARAEEGDIWSATESSGRIVGVEGEVEVLARVMLGALAGAGRLAPKVDYTPNEVIHLVMRYGRARAVAEREDTRQAWDQANELLDRLRVVISGQLGGGALPEGMEFRPAAVWMCGAQHAVRPCTSRNQHRGLSCGWRPARTPEEPRP